MYEVGAKLPWSIGWKPCLPSSSHSFCRAVWHNPAPTHGRFRD